MKNIVKNLFYYYLSISVILFFSCNEQEQQKNKINFLNSKNIIILDASSYKDSTWIPTNKDLDNALKGVESFLQNPDIDDEYYLASVKKIILNIQNYTAQFSGQYRNGKRIIWCNFFPKEDIKEIDYDLNKVPYLVNDGGFYHWKIIYDVQNNKVYNFIVNGEA